MSRHRLGKDELGACGVPGRVPNGHITQLPAASPVTGWWLLAALLTFLLVVTIGVIVTAVVRHEDHD